MTIMKVSEALAIVADIASRWGENAEEAFPRRITADDSDDALRAMLGADPDEIELEEAIEVRDIWRALKTVNMLIEQKITIAFTAGTH